MQLEHKVFLEVIEVETVVLVPCHLLDYRDLYWTQVDAIMLS